MKPTLSAALLGAALASVPAVRAADAPPPSAALAANDALGRQWRERMGFTDEQFQRFSAAEKAKEDELRPLRGRMRDALEKLRGLVAAQAPDKDVGAALDALAAARSGVAAANDRFDAALGAFLTPTQRAKMIIGMPIGDSETDGAADPRAAELHQALTDGDAEQE